MYHILIYSLSIILLLNSAIFAQTTGLDNQLHAIKINYEVVGMSVLIAKDSNIAFSKGYGLRDRVRNLPVNDSTIYRIASISKFITAATLMKLYEEGLFNLDDDVSSHLGFTLRNPAFPNDAITIRKVLSHTSSLRDGDGYSNFLSATYNNNPPPLLSDLLVQGGSYFSSDMFSPNRSPSSNYFYYANVNYGIVGTLIEKLSNKRFDIYCREKIFKPLEMTASFNINDLPDVNQVAVLYRKLGNNWIAQADNYNGLMPPPRDLSNYIIGTNGLIFGPQGGLRVSANDLAKFMVMIMNGGVYNSVRILADSTVSMILEPQWIYTGSNGNNYYGIFNTYGLGASRTNDLLPNETLYGHPGEAYGLISDLYFSKLKDYGIIFITNGGVWGYGTYSGWYNIEENIYQACYNYLDSLTTNLKSDAEPEKGFILYQNYPNPFNPETTIMWQSSTDGWQTLKVYDLLGNQIATLVNEFKPAGNYSIKFSLQLNENNAKLASGVYIYQLTVGAHKNQKIMQLLK